MASVKPHTGEAGYAATKGAINVASKYLAIELGASNIRVNVARMGWMLGVPVQGFVSRDAKEKGVPEKTYYDAIAANIPLRRLVTDTECAHIASWSGQQTGRAVWKVGRSASAVVQVVLTPAERRLFWTNERMAIA